MAGDSSDGGASSSSSSDAVLIPKPLDLRHRQKLQAQLQQQRARELKSELLCAVCERGDGADDALVVCAGPCVSAFHRSCLAAADGAQSDAAPWRCASCRAGTHECFHCKQPGADQAEEEAAGDAATGTGRPVRKCRALSCGKFYHLDCITQYPLARIAGTHFICPLHTCAACDQSGAQKEAVRCVRCPVAYHASCLPENVRHLTAKLIVCAKHSSAGAVKPSKAAKIAEAASSGRQRSSSVEIKKEKPEKIEKEDKARRRLDDIANEDGAMSEASVRSAVSISSTGSKKPHKSKKEKRDKDKKKKKKKKKKDKEKDKEKVKRRDSRTRLGMSSQDEESTAASGDEVSGATDKHARNAESSSRRSSVEPAAQSPEVSKSVATPTKEKPAERLDDGVKVDVGLTTPASLKNRGDSSNASSKTAPSPYGADSPSLLFESPATTKQRLVEALGGSDDDDDDDEEEEKLAAPVQSAAASATTPSMDIDTKITTSPQKKPNSADEAGLDEKPRTGELHSPGKQGDAAVRDDSRIEKSPDLERIKPPAEASSVKREPIKNATSPMPMLPSIERLAVQIPKSGSSSSLKSLSKSNRMKDVSDGEDGDDEGPGGATTPRSRRLARIKSEQSAMVTPRGGSRGSKKKKKKGKMHKSTAESDNDTASGEQPNEETAVVDEAKWVQCDNCKKWRTVAQSIDLASMPERWYCHMNSWNRSFASCDVAEEEVSKQRTPQKAPPSLQASATDRSKKKSKKKKGIHMIAGGGTGSDGGSSSSSSAGKSGKDTPQGSSAIGIGPSNDAVDGTSAKQTKKQDKQDKQEKRKKRKLSKIKDKYREVKWVQCESAQCGKWRVVPSSIDFDLLPPRWYCHLNSWAPELAKCSASNPPDVEAFLHKQPIKDNLDNTSTTSRNQSNKRPKTLSSGGDLSLTSASLSPEGPRSGTGNAGGASEGSKPLKTGKLTKSSSSSSNAGQQPPFSNSGHSGQFKSDSQGPGSIKGATVLSAVAVATGTSHHAVDIKGPQSQPSSTSSKSSKSSCTSSGGSEIKKTVLEWAQCEKCNKWRKLPSHIKSSTLPDKWYCSMNHWDPARAKCSIPEEVEPEPLAIGPIPGTPGWYHGSHETKTGSGGGGSRPSRRGKLSYTELLYGNTGQLRKTYTPESSTLSFEYEGVTYHRDDMYKHSSLYMSSEAMEKAIARANSEPDASETIAQFSLTPPAAAGQISAWLGLSLSSNASGSGGDPSSSAVGISAVLITGAGEREQQVPLESVSTAILAAMDLRREWSVSELFDKVNGASYSDSVSLPTLAAALGELECKGLIERLDEDQARAWKKRRTETETNEKSNSTGFGAALNAVLLYRKVPARPLKASKWWRSATGITLPLPTE